MDKVDYPCIIDTITDTHMSFFTVGPAVTNYKFICYCDVIGRVPGTVVGRIEGGFIATIELTPNRVHRVMERLEWYQDHQATQQGQGRQHDRHSPNQVQAQMRLSNGSTFPCEILNVSFSGMAIRSSVQVSVGAPIAVGNLQGVVVRAEGNDLGIKFNDMLSKTSLETVVR
ncbi:MAG: PilZ domain-containing protein [Pseudomonadota bacterium]